MTTILNKKIIFFVGALLCIPMNGVIIENKFRTNVGVITDEYLSGTISFYDIKPNERKDIGSDKLFGFAVSAISETLPRSLVKILVDDLYNKDRDNNSGTLIPDTVLKKYATALTQLPNAVITIIPDPKMPTRPIAVLPMEELDELLKKEVVKTLGEVVPAMAKPVANVAASYCTFEDNPGE